MSTAVRRHAPERLDSRASRVPTPNKLWSFHAVARHVADPHHGARLLVSPGFPTEAVIYSP